MTRVLVLALVSLVVVSCGEPPAPPPPERHVVLEGDPNFRDLGGYRTADGRTVKWREVFRSGELAHLTEADVSVLEALGLRTVVNFLTPEEISTNGEDRLPGGFNHIRNSFFSSSILMWKESSIDRDDDVESRLATLVECLQMLPSHSRNVVTRYYFDRQPIDAIADAGFSKGPA